MNKSKFILKSNFPIILASKSEIRGKLMEKTGIKFKQISSNLNEENFKKNNEKKSFSLLSAELAQKKALEVSKKNKSTYVIGADQVCVFNNIIVNKPKIKKNAILQLNKLNGKSHKQISSVALCYNEKVIWTYTDTAYLKMKKLTLNIIKLYIDIDLPLASCGSYRYESQGKYLFSSVKGNIDTIQGLPVLPLLKKLHEKKIISYV